MRSLTRRALSAALALSFALAADAAGSAPDPPVAVVYDLRGAATVAAPGAARRAARLFDWLAPRTTIRVTSGTVAIAFHDGARFELAAGSEVVVEPSGPNARRGTVRTLDPVSPFPRIPGVTTDLTGSRPGAIVVRALEMSGLDPRKGAVASAASVELGFAPVDGATRYLVEVWDSAGSVVYRNETEATRQRLPAGTLQRASAYAWRVRTLDLKGAVATGEGAFETLSETDEGSHDALRKTAEREASAAGFALLGAVERRMRLFGDARRSLARALELQPGDRGLTEALAELNEPPARPRAGR